MPKAFVLVNAEEFSQELMKEIKKIKGVEQAFPVYGVYDIIVKTKAETMEKIKETHNKIRKLHGVRQTLTMIAHEE